MAERAPLYSDLADGPEPGRALWMRATDGVRLRVGLWWPEDAAATVLLFPGRTEYIEKYGRTAHDLARHRLATLVIDWRGQGLSDRLTADPMLGHVHRFTDYQRDVAAMLTTARALNLPRPWFLLAHSMGGCIGLRAAIDGLPVAACAFTGPMWGIRMARGLSPLARALAWGAVRLRLGQRYAPGTKGEHYVLSEPFETNELTGDAAMYHYMAGQLRAHPELGIGGPSFRWLHEALKEMRALARRPAPDMPCLTLVGSLESIVDMRPIEARMRHWPGGRLKTIPGGRHEVLMEDAATRARVLDLICDVYRKAGRNAARGPQPDTAASPG